MDCSFHGEEVSYDNVDDERLKLFFRCTLTGEVVVSALCHYCTKGNCVNSGKSNQITVYCVENCSKCDVCDKLREKGYIPNTCNVSKNQYVAVRLIVKMCHKIFGLPLVEDGFELKSPDDVKTKE